MSLSLCPWVEKIAKNTLNEKIGIIGGISILGNYRILWNHGMNTLGEMKEELSGMRKG